MLRVKCLTFSLFSDLCQVSHWPAVCQVLCRHPAALVLHSVPQESVTPEADLAEVLLPESSTHIIAPGRQKKDRYCQADIVRQILAGRHFRWSFPEKGGELHRVRLNTPKFLFKYTDPSSQGGEVYSNMNLCRCRGSVYVYFNTKCPWIFTLKQVSSNTGCN